ncbi:hypothetical protein QN277_015462 [Acacia crassicarpa]|uniref:RING-type E3 ubiquitin transferase n=1 Tax=Acacia crassicarpa TaxID=499986 RepID=A0AAE1MTF0_9FABA|nr:hypothetical protein QN277_015462 [Acacia crassicarpa]
MQGQRGAIGSLPETLEFNCGSTSSNPTVDQPICWNNMRNPVDNDSDIPEYLLPLSNMNPPYMNPISHEWQNSSGWSLGGPSSSNTQSEINNNQQKRELGWTSPISANAAAGPRAEGRHFEPTIVLSSDNVNSSPMYMHSSNSHMSPNLNLNAELADSGDNSQHLEHPILHKSSGSVNERVLPGIVSGPIPHPPGNNSFVPEGTDARPGCSVDARRAPCKRKAIEENVGPSLDGGSSSSIQHTESSAWNTLPTQENAGSSLSRSASSEEVNARLGLGMGDEAPENLPHSNDAGSTESFRRNLRLRISPSSQQNSIPPPAFSSGSVIRHSSMSTSSMSQRFPPVDNPLDLRAAPMVDNIIPQSQPLVIHVPTLPRNMQSLRWNGSSSSSNSQSSSPLVCADRDNQPREESSSRSISRNIFDRPVFVPSTDLRNLVRNPTVRASGSANLSMSGNVASSSRAGSNSAINQSSTSAWVSRPNPPQYPRRLSEYVRRSLFSPPSETAGSQNPSNNYSSLRSGPTSSSEERVPSSGAGIQGHHQSQPRSLWMERQGDAEFGIPYSLRSLAAAGEGSSSRLVSELRNVLGLMRRGGGLRFEDVMIFDQSVFSGVADIHDRHRDMRLDVDNMSYEELLALEERIGNVSTGLSEETVMKLLKQKKYSVETGSKLEAEPCCVCQEEYNDGDEIGILDCGHDFHKDCVKQWLMHKNLCPICKTTGLSS